VLVECVDTDAEKEIDRGREEEKNEQVFC